MILPLNRTFVQPVPISRVEEITLTTPVPPNSSESLTIPTFTEPQVSAPVPRPDRQGPQECAGAVQRRPTKRTQHRQIPMPAATVRREHMSSGSWIWQHSALDNECRMHEEYELFYQATRLESMGFEQHNLTF